MVPVLSTKMGENLNQGRGGGTKGPRGAQRRLVTQNGFLVE